VSAGLVAEALVQRGAFELELDLRVGPAHPLALIGPNGAGKSTALLALAGVLPIARGTIALGDRMLAHAATGLDLPASARGIGFVFQHSALFSHLTVRENIAFGPRAQAKPRHEIARLVEHWIERVGLGALVDRYPAELSGGQAQRVALARALAAEPGVLLLDEPLSALDVESRDEVRADLAQHVRNFAGMTVVVAHDRDDVAALADDVLVLEHGRVVQRGTLAQLAAEPATDFVQRFTAP
jgi:molybdate transport system ATP-binding protein